VRKQEMPLYGGIDLHANNQVVVLLDEQDQMFYHQRLSNHLPTILMKWKTKSHNGSALVYGSSGCSPRRCSACRCHRRELSERLPIGGRPSVMLNISV
jgi:hypothetical protein